MTDVAPGIDPKTCLNSMDALPVAIFVVDPDACPVYLNSKARMLIRDHGAHMSEPWVRHPLFDLLDLQGVDTDRRYSRKRSPVIKALQGNEASADEITLKMGRQRRYFQVWAAPVFFKENKNFYAVVTFMDITEQKRMESQLKWRNLELQSLIDQVSKGKQDLRALSKRLLTIQEEERRHIARELHDEVGQALTLLKIKLQTLPETPRAGDDGFRILEKTDMGEMISSIDHTLEQVRNLCVNLRPSVLDDLGLVAALRWFADRQAQLSGIEMRFQTSSDIGRVASEIETASFRLVQEALTNIVRHSGATRAQIGLEQDEKGIHLRIADNGKGFNLAGAREKARDGESTGLLGIRERVHLLQGRIDIKSRSGQGTRIDVFFPFSRSRDLDPEEIR